MANELEIVVRSSYDGSGVEAGRQDLSRLVQDFKRGTDEMSRAQLDRARAARTGQGFEQADAAFAQKLRQQEQLIPAIRREITDLQKRRDDLFAKYVAQGMPKEALEHPLYRPRDLTAFDQLIDWAARNAPSLRDEQRLEAVAQRQWREDQRKQKADARFKYLIEQTNEDTMRQIREESEQTVQERTEQRRQRIIGAASAFGGMTLFQSLRGMPVSEETAALRYRIGAPGTRDGAGVDELGRQISDVGRAMSYSRLETLKAADAYSSVAGRLGKELIPEVEQLSRAARFLRMDFGEAGQFFGGLRRMTREDDPMALQRIVGVVTNAVMAAGPRGDEMREAIKFLAARAAKGSPEGLAGQSLEIQVAMLRTLTDIAKERGLPGFQGQGGAETIVGMSQFGFNASDMNDVIRYRLLTGTEDELTGHPSDVRGKARLEMSRLQRGDFRDEKLVDRVFAAWENAPRVMGSRTPEGRMDAVISMLGLQLSPDQVMKLQETLMSGKGREALKETMQQMSTEKFEGPEAAQRDTGFMRDQESHRKVTDALEKLGDAATYARNKLYGIGGGGMFGDFAALTMQGIGFGAGFGIARSALGFGGRTRLVRGILGGAARWGSAALNRVGLRGAGNALARSGATASTHWMARSMAGGGAATTVATGGRLARLAGGLRRGAGRIGPALLLEAGAMGADYMGDQAVEDSLRRDTWYGGGAAARIGAWTLAGSAFGPIGTAGGFAIGAYQNRMELFTPMFQRKERREQEERMDRMMEGKKGDAAAYQLFGESIKDKDKYGEAVLAYLTLRKEGQSQKKAFQNVREMREFMDPEGKSLINLSDEQLQRARADLSGVGASVGKKNELHIKMDVNVTGNKEIADAIAKRAGEVLEDNLPEDIYQPLSSGYSTNGRLA